MNILSWILKLTQLIPIIAAGVQSIHANKSVETKTQLAQDAIGMAVNGSKLLLPTEHAELAAQIGELAQTEIGTVVATLHNAAQPAAA